MWPKLRGRAAARCVDYPCRAVPDSAWSDGGTSVRGLAAHFRNYRNLAEPKPNLTYKAR